MIPEEFLHWRVTDFTTYVLTVFDVGDDRDKLAMVRVVIDLGLWPS